MQTFRSGKFTVLIPYYNEAEYLEACLRSWLEQEEAPVRMILVDNGSTDGSAEIAAKMAAENPFVEWNLLEESTPGKVHAMKTGAPLIDTEYVAMCDADCWYPTHYLKLKKQLFEQGGEQVVAVMAQYTEGDPQSEENKAIRRNVMKSARRFPTKCFTGGAGQTFRSVPFLDVGGFDPDIWAFTQLDHEIMHRLHTRGKSVYHPDLWVLHTDRRKDRSRVRWSLLDRMLYRYTPHSLGDWFFYSWLKKRHEKRKMSQLLLREQQWKQQEK